MKVISKEEFFDWAWKELYLNRKYPDGTVLCHECEADLEHEDPAYFELTHVDWEWTVEPCLYHCQEEEDLFEETVCQRCVQMPCVCTEE